MLNNLPYELKESFAYKIKKLFNYQLLIKLDPENKKKYFQIIKEKVSARIISKAYKRFSIMNKWKNIPFRIIYLTNTLPNIDPNIDYSSKKIIFANFKSKFVDSDKYNLLPPLKIQSDIDNDGDWFGYDDYWSDDEDY